ncbi:MAG: hypothetical protein LBH40_03050 [Alphaproteobacteria bacterium]|jgi:hypothetical protein|nr:hypothetical protein [Alphaproteobacteria bacterium]
MNILNKKLSIIGITSFFISLSSVYADFSVTVNKQVNIEKEQKVTAKIDGEQKIIEGLLKTTPHMEKANTNIIDISWIAILDQKGRVNVSNLTSTIDLDKKFLQRGTALLVQGNLPGNLKLKTEEEKKEDKKKDIPTSNGSTSINTGGVSSPLEDNTIGNELQTPEYIRTYDGCTQLYNQEKEIIHAYQQIYYIDKDGNKKITQECSRIKDFPAEREDCDIFNDFTNHISYQRYQPYFTEDDKTYAAGGCVPAKQFIHQIDYLVCEAIAVDDTYIKQGQWYYAEDNGDKKYISGCILDPEGKTDNLKIQFEGCPVSHDIQNSQSKHLGKYYWIRSDNTIEYLGDCVETKDSYFQHILDWNGNNEWKHDNNNGFSQRVMTRYILIPQEDNRKIVIDDKELDPTKYPHSKIQNGYKYYDDLNRGAPTGHDVNWMRTIVKFGNQQFFTGKDFEEGYINHKKIGQPQQYRESCGSKLNPKSRFYYKDHIERVDGSTYLTNTYDTGCS